MNLSDKMKPAVSELLTKMADDALIIGHRNAEWTGIGPTLEEDIAFGSMAQDKVGHAYNFYNLLSQTNGGEVDDIAFRRKESEYKCCHLVELPIGDDFGVSLMRHFLFDHAEYLRYELLTYSTFQPLADLARKYRPEIKYHLFHANTWIKQLSAGTEESRARMQSALTELWPYALSIFEPGPFDEINKIEGIFPGERELQRKWTLAVSPILEGAGLKIPAVDEPKAQYGGRQGYHTDHFAGLLAEMTEVLRTEPDGAEW